MDEEAVNKYRQAADEQPNVHRPRNSGERFQDWSSAILSRSQRAIWLRFWLPGEGRRDPDL